MADMAARAAVRELAGDAALGLRGPGGATGARALLVLAALDDAAGGEVGGESTQRRRDGAAPLLERL